MNSYEASICVRAAAQAYVSNHLVCWPAHGDKEEGANRGSMFVA